MKLVQIQNVNIDGVDIETPVYLSPMMGVLFNDDLLSYDELLNIDELSLRNQRIYKIDDFECPFGHIQISPTRLIITDGVPVEIADIEEVPLETLKDDLLKKIADIRWNKCQSFVYDGVENVKADSAISVVNATLTMRNRRGVPPEYAQMWKLAPNEFRHWNEAQIEEYGFAIGDHVQQCFNEEALLAEIINSAESIDDLRQVLS